MQWGDVGKWLKDNAGTGAALVGSLITGNVRGAVAAGVALVSSATGTNDPAVALEQLKQDPAAMIRLKELAVQEAASIREHLRAMAELDIKDRQAEHAEQQQTIRNGDNSEDEYVRRTRPLIARQSWYGTLAYVFVFEIMSATKLADVGANWELAMLLISPAAAYLGFRAWEKRKATA